MFTKMEFFSALFDCTLLSPFISISAPELGKTLESCCTELNRSETCHAGKAQHITSSCDLEVMSLPGLFRRSSEGQRAPSGPRIPSNGSGIPF